MNKPLSDHQLHASVLDNLDDAVLAVDTEGTVTLINPSAQDFLGVSEKQAIGLKLKELLNKEKTLCYLVDIALTEGRSIADHENIILRTSGLPPRPVSATASALFSAHGEQEGAVLIMHDQTRLRELEEVIKRTDRLSMLGTLACGLAHEIKNPLSGIKGAAQLLAMELGDNKGLEEYPKVMVREVERVNTIIEELLNLGTPRSSERIPVNLLQILNDIVLLQQEAQTEKDIRFSLQFDPSIPPLQGDPNLLTQMFLNLIKNAGEAVPQQGTIEIVARIATKSHRNRPNSRPGPMVEVQINDNGQGIAAEDLERIFTPFYTTKPTGSGLGMAICQKIIADHDGLLTVESTCGQGTRISVSLPVHS